MIDKIKSFFKNLASCWRYEEHLIKACNRATPLHRKFNLAISVAVCFTIFLFCLACIPASAAEIQPRVPIGSVPTDLTGYTVTVPANWTAPSGYGNYDIQGVFTDSFYGENPFTSFYVGYALNLDTFRTYPSADHAVYLGYLSNFPNGNSLSFTVSSGADSSNSSLIRWLVDNNATFTNGSEPEPNPLATFNKGLYKVSSTWYNSDISTQLDGMTFYSLSEGDLFTALTVQNDELIFDDENGDMHIMARNTTTGAKWIDNSGQFVYFINDESIPQNLAEQIPTLLEYIPDVSLTEYQRMQDSWYYGVQDGFTEGYNQASRDTEGTFLGNIFGGVFDALDKFQMFGQFSFLDFIKSIIGILALIWFLKLLAGG